MEKKEHWTPIGLWLDCAALYRRAPNANVANMTQSKAWVYRACAILVGVFLGSAHTSAESVTMRLQDHSEIVLKKSLLVPMRDGIRLSTDVYLPGQPGERFPVILIRTPYNKNMFRKGSQVGTFPLGPHDFAAHGYAVVVQDTRGKFESEGVFDYSADFRDGPDTIEWAASQPWSNGKIGTYGCSALGETQYRQATQRNPHLAAMVPQAAGTISRYRTDFFHGGALELADLVGWLRENGSKINYVPSVRPEGDALPYWAEYFKPQAVLPEVNYPELMSHLPVIDIMKKAGSPPTDYEEQIKAFPPPTDLDGIERGEFTNPWWKRSGYIKSTDRFDVPALHINGWYDWGVAETLNMFNQLRVNADSNRARDNQFAIISPADHCASESATEDTVIGTRHMGDARLAYSDIYLRWFDHWLKGADNSVTKMPKLQIYVMGKNQWRGENEWPLARTRFTNYYLHSAGDANSLFGNGVLSTEIPMDQPADVYFSDPRNPVPYAVAPVEPTGPRSWYLRQGAFDQSAVQARNDVLVYTTPPLKDGVEVTGPLQVVLYVSSSAKDTDFVAKLVDVYPDGTAYDLQVGILRARYREGFDRTVFMQPGGVYQVRINLHATSNYFRAGHRIRLEVTSSNFPRFDRNLNTGGNNYDETIGVIARNVIHHSRQYPSHVILPVIPEQ